MAADSGLWDVMERTDERADWEAVWDRAFALASTDAEIRRLVVGPRFSIDELRAFIETKEAA